MRSTGSGSPLVEAVIFDMDGTLIESTDVVTAAFRAAVVAGGGPVFSDADIVAAYPLGPPRRILEHLLGRPVTSGELDLYYSHLASGRVRTYDGVEHVLSLIAQRASVAVFTGASRKAAQILLGGAGLLGFFAVVVGGDEVAHPKPEPDGILLACDRLGVEPGSVAYVGDSPLDLRAARRAGALAVAAAWGHLYDAGQAADRTARQPIDLCALVSPQASRDTVLPA